MPAKVKTKYEANNGDVHQIVLTPEYAAVAGTAPAGDVTNDIKVKVSKTTREYGLKPRRVTLARTIGSDPDTFVKYSLLPVLTQTAFQSGTFALGATVTIDEVAWEIVAKIPEKYN